VKDLPKAELHVHLEGCLEADLLFELARRNEIVLPWPSVDALRAAYRFDGLPAFLALYFQGCEVLRREQDFYDLTRGYLARAYADGVVHAEMFLGPQSFLDRGVPMADILGGAFRAMDDAQSQDGISSGLLVSAHRHRDEADAFALLEAVMPWAGQIAGFGLGGAELGNPPSKFRRYFDELHRLDFRTCAHAGEEGPAGYVREALDLLAVDRIDHGVRAMEDPALVADLAERQTPLTVCPISNVLLRVVEELEQHPLPAMLGAGLNVSLNSDDPAYFGAYLSDTFSRTAAALNLDEATMKTLAANSLRAAFTSSANRLA
jgi:adenosine deaminase